MSLNKITLSVEEKFSGMNQVGKLKAYSEHWN